MTEDEGLRDGSGADADGGDMLDLHMHSTFSDGSEDVAALVAQARAAGLAGIAITDHDSLSQLSAVRATARKLGFPVLAGVEVSACDPASGRKVHVLGYSLEATADGTGPLERLVAPTIVARTANTLWQAWVLRRAGARFGDAPVVSLDRVVEVAGKSTGVYKQHVMEAVCGLPYSDPSYQQFYRRWFKNGGPAQRDIEYPRAADAVRAIREQGGVPVLAHPGQMNSWDAIPGLVRAGLLGIEVHHPDHSAAHVGAACAAADKYGLMRTGGSDYHGRFGAPPAAGACRISLEEAGDAVSELFAREGQLR
jgi:predicted metal-dependent phosphoesterase TrpH